MLPAQRAAAAGRVAHKKVVHVSPFLTPTAPTGSVDRSTASAADVRIDLHRDGAPDFVARLPARRAGRSPIGALLARLARFPLMTAQVIGAIHLEAMRLWRAGLPYPPNPPATRRPLARATRP